MRFTNTLYTLGILSLFGALVIALGIGGAYWYLATKLPATEVLRDVRLQVPLQIYTRDGALIAKFGEQRRTPLRRDQISERLIQAFIAVEDNRFYEHPGVDWQGLTRAVVYLLRTGEKGPGGSTITMQVARNFFLGREKTYIRKLNEILLALKIERELTKDQILELYCNKIFFGQRAYGIGAAARVYYGRPISELSLAQLAMIAGLPKAPSRFNPIANPERAIIRRNYVLRRMLELGYIEPADYEQAQRAPVTAATHGPVVEVEAPYVAEMVRARLEAIYGDVIYTAGYKVYTTLDRRLQHAANAALRHTLIAYDSRHGYRGAEGQIPADAATSSPEAVLADIPTFGGLVPALVTSVSARAITAHARGVGSVELGFEHMDWTRPYVSANRRGTKPESPAAIAAVGDIIRVQPTEDGWDFSQLPEVEGALVSLDPDDGAITALSGGFDFYRSKFNRVLQARRQPGSSFKPFIYSAALDRGYTPASIINDAPVVFEDPSLKSAWRPENFSGKFFGPTRLRVALYKSRNLVSIRLLRDIGIDVALDHIARFGIDPEPLPRSLSLALGSGVVTPLELATGYAVFANGGYAIEPYFITRVLDWNDKELLIANPLVACRDCEATATATATAAATDSGGARHPPRAVRQAPRAIEARNAWLMYSLMRDVIRRGTGRKARVLERDDIAGKTGTTNDQKDAWFSGFTPDIVTTAWVGFDQFRPLGTRETGSQAALPMWIAYMREALEDIPQRNLKPPEGIVAVRIDPTTGQLADAAHPEAVFESFRKEQVPSRRVEPTPGIAADGATTRSITEQLF